jgi:hypothetical protein
MKIRIGNFDLNVWEVPPETIVDVLRTVMENSDKVAKLSAAASPTQILINGNATGCAIGPGAQFNARDVVTILKRGEGDPTAQELMVLILDRIDELWRAKLGAMTLTDTEITPGDGNVGKAGDVRCASGKGQDIHIVRSKITAGAGGASGGDIRSGNG